MVSQSCFHGLALPPCVGAGTEAAGRCTKGKKMRESKVAGVSSSGLQLLFRLVSFSILSDYLSVHPNSVVIVSTFAFAVINLLKGVNAIN